MKPAPFEYVRAATMREALAVLAEHGDEARPLAGGQSLVPMMNLRLARPSVLVDINGLDANGIGMDDHRISLGALVRHADILQHGPVTGGRPSWRKLCAASRIRRFASAARSGGVLRMPTPTAELPVLAMLLDGEIEVRSLTIRDRSRRSISSVARFLPALKPASSSSRSTCNCRLVPGAPASWRRPSVRGDFALAAAGVRIELSGDSIAAAAIVLSGARSAPVRASAAEALLTGERPGAALCRAAARAALERVESYGDIRGSAAFGGISSRFSSRMRSARPASRAGWLA